VRTAVRIDVRSGYQAQVVDARGAGALLRGVAPSRNLEGDDGAASGAHEPMIDIVGVKA